MHEDNEKYQYAMVGYQLKNTLTENGSVARGVCDIDGDGKLVSVTEHTTIVKRGENAAYRKMMEKVIRIWQEIRLFP